MKRPCFYAVLILFFQAVSAAALDTAGLTPVPEADAETAEDSDLRWYDAPDIGVEGRGWTATASFYDRMPAKAEGVIPASVWGLSRDSSGMCVRFVTDAGAIAARWTLRDKGLDMYHMPSTGVSGLDLYARQGDAWRWTGLGRPKQYPENEDMLIEGLPEGVREYRLYLPLYNGVTEVKIGIPEKATLWKAPAYPAEKAKPIVFYGTSITQGGCASRPGMACPAIIGRWLNRPVINLGFSGNGRLQPEVVPLLPEIDAALFFIDCLPNMKDPEVVEKQVYAVVKGIREKQPDTPVILAEDRPYGKAFLLESVQKSQTDRRAGMRRAYEKLIAEGVTRLHYLEENGQIGSDNEALVDGSHCTDLGFLRQAEYFTPAIREALAD
jgi:hypothetical protein